MSLYQRVTALDSLCNCCADFVLLRLFLKFIIGRYLKYFGPVYPLQAMLVNIVLARTWSKAGCSSEEETCRGGGCKVWHQETCSLIKLRGSAVPPVADKSNESSWRKASHSSRGLFLNGHFLPVGRVCPAGAGCIFSRSGIDSFPKNSFTSFLDPNITLPTLALAPSHYIVAILAEFSSHNSQSRPSRHWQCHAIESTH